MVVVNFIEVILSYLNISVLLLEKVAQQLSLIGQEENCVY